MLEGAHLVLAVVEQDDRVIDASVAVTPAHVADLRDAVDDMKAELAAALSHHGWRLETVQIVAADPGLRAPLGPPKRGEMIEEVACTIAEKKAYEVEAFCDLLGLPPNPDADPWKSKAVYARGRLAGLAVPDLMRVARQVLDELDNHRLQALVDRYRPAGPHGGVKNLIFGSTSKPDLVLADALYNELALVSADKALMYDDGIPDEGMSWRRLVRALLPQHSATDERAAARTLYGRLVACLGSEPERRFFHAYARCYKQSFDSPALIPQVWVHYDPRSRRQRADSPVLTTQRMDFVLLLPVGRRVVCEIDGKTHYTDDGGEASPGRYAQMVRDDRELRLRGYEVYRFGAAELPDDSAAQNLVDKFFDRLLGMDAL